VDADDPALQACRRIDRPPGGWVGGGAGFPPRILVDLLDDRPMPGQLAPRVDAVNRRPGARALSVVVEVASQVIAPGPRLAVLPECDPNFLSFGHVWIAL
jgi:hypothetical protein